MMTPIHEMPGICWCGETHIAAGADFEWPPLGLLHAKQEPEQLVSMYVFRSEAPHPMNGRLCTIIERAGLDETSTEPTFMVEFNNGRKVRAFSNELSPWFPAR